MECDINLYCQLDSNSVRKNFEYFLSSETRPIFEEDVERESDKPMFRMFEDIPYPEHIQKVSENALLLHWFVGSDFNEEDLLKTIDSFKTCGALSQSCLVSFDGLPSYKVVLTVESKISKTIHIEEDSDEFYQVLGVFNKEKSIELYLASLL
jgi:hypothetical protein